MKKYIESIKSYFLFTKQQRNGILLLIGLLLLAHLLYYFVSFSTKAEPSIEDIGLAKFQKQIDSLKQIAIQNSKLKIFPFNPNFISDYKGYQLGMSMKEIDRLQEYRQQGKFVNSAIEFQQVTEVSDSLLNSISTYFKFPFWVQKREKKSRPQRSFNHQTRKDKNLTSTTDLNLATTNDFLAIEGVEEELAERIIKYRVKLHGFVFPDQIREVWGLQKELADRIGQVFTIQEIPQITKLNINTTNFKEVLKNPYIDYDLCIKIFDYRDEVAELQDISELKNIEGFPVQLYDRIVVYLSAK